jgi:2-keto-4-pentenoate hydratase/2-oxohepta-3-ene-1,7-dioic acid hydratase in catechol pathway
MPPTTWLLTLWWSVRRSELQEIPPTPDPTIKAGRSETYGKYTDKAGIDAFCPFGPVLVSPGQLPDPAELSVQVIINGEEKEVQAQGAALENVQR